MTRRKNSLLSSSMFRDAFKSLSTYVIPLLCGLYVQFPKLRNIVLRHMIPISVIGIVNVTIQKRTPFEKTVILLGHLAPFLLSLVYKPVPSADLFLTLFIALAFISFIPVWTYELSREQMMAMYVLFFTPPIVPALTGQTKYRAT